MTERNEQGEEDGGEPMRQRDHSHRRRRRGRRRIHRYNQLRTGILLIAASLMAMLLCTLIAQGPRPEGMPVEPSSDLREYQAEFHSGKGANAQPNSGRTPEAPMKDGFGPDPSLLPYLVFGPPVILILDMLRRWIQRSVKRPPDR
jgi:hypothetical protein